MGAARGSGHTRAKIECAQRTTRPMTAPAPLAGVTVLFNDGDTPIAQALDALATA